jgi:LacI family transcriptional regulator
MAKRPTIGDLAAAAGVSVATVDRILNRRHPVKEATAERVARAAEQIGFHATALIRRGMVPGGPVRTFGFLLQKRSDVFYRQLAADLSAATADSPDVRANAVVEFVDELSPGTLAEGMRRLGERADALAVVSIDHPHVSEEIAALADRGVPTFAIISDLTAERRAGYVGRDNRREGRTAAWFVERTARRPGKVGIIVGSHRYVCQETAEISFRSYFREHAPDFRLAEPLVNLEDGRIAYEATIAMMARAEDLVGIYVCGGGVEGVVRAVRDETEPGRLAVVCNELTPVTRSGLIDGVLTAVIATRTAEVAQRVVAAMAAAVADGAERSAPIQTFVPFDIHLRETV